MPDAAFRKKNNPPDAHGLTAAKARERAQNNDASDVHGLTAAKARERVQNNDASDVHGLTAAKARERVQNNDPSDVRGLTAAEVEERVQKGLVNISEKSGARTVKGIVFTHTVTYFNLLILFFALIIFFTGHWKNMLFIGVVICNAAIGIFQELKVKQLIDELSVITQTQIAAVREGKRTRIAVEEIVVDDLLLLAVGDQIVADGRVIAAQGLEVNESMLTGESLPIKKKKGDELLSGSFVVAGEAAMKVEAVGNHCYAAELVSHASNKKRASSEMQRAIKSVIQIISVAIIPIGLLLFRSQYIAGEGSLGDAIVRTVSGLIGMIPEGLVLLTSVSFIIGVGRLAKKRALVQEMAAIEALARTNILCTDKTGTITTGQLRVKELLPLAAQKEAEIKEILSQMNGAGEDANVTQNALSEHFGRRHDWIVKSAIPFSSGRKYRAVAFAERGNYVLGAPEILAAGNDDLLKEVLRYSEQGLRVILLASAGSIDTEKAAIGFTTPLALILIEDVIKEDAAEIFEYFRNAGVDVKVLSGDHPVTVSAIAKRAGLPGAERYVDARSLPKNPIALAQEITKYSVFGRVSPEQKQSFVKAWQTNGKTVAMVGDGVNDVLAIKDADCGIAMAAGAEAAKQAAHIVLLDSEFTSLREIVAEGKTIISNIERVSALYLTKTIYASILSVIFIFLNTAYPFTPLQMGLINLCGIGMPSFLLTLEQPDEKVSDGFLSHVLRVSLPASLAVVTAVIIVQVLSVLFRWDTALTGTFNLILGGLVSILVVASVCWPLNRFREAVLAISGAVFLSAILCLPKFYDIHPLWTAWSLLLIPLVLLTAMMLPWYARFTDWARAWLKRNVHFF